MDIDRLIRTALKVQSIPSPTFHESKRGEYMFSLFQEANASSVEKDQAGNIYACLEGGSVKPLIISAHLDTVFPLSTPIEHKISKQRIIGPGIGDNALALAVLVELAKDLREIELPGDVWLVANVGEEGMGNLSGMREVVQRFGSDVSAYIVLEGIALGYIYHRGLPVRRFLICAEAQGGHAWIHSDRPSAVHTICQVGDTISQIPLPITPKSILNIGRIEGGTSVNSIASKAWMEIDVRSESEDTVNQLEHELSVICRKFSSNECVITLKRMGERPFGEIPQDHALVQKAVWALEQSGIHDWFLDSGSTDANIPLSMGYPCICVGITSGGSAHSLEEFIELSPITSGYSALYLLIKNAFDL